MTHGAYVQPGWSLGAELGGSRAQVAESHTSQSPSAPSTRSGTELQLRGGWGRRFGEKRGVSLSVIVPVVMPYATSFDAYYQLTSGPLDVGAGALLSFFAPGVYLEAGHRFGRGLELSGGLQAALIDDAAMLTYFGLLTVRPSEHLGMGLWADYHRPSRTLAACDENCDPEDYVDSWLSGGFSITVYFGAPYESPSRSSESRGAPRGAPGDATAFDPRARSGSTPDSLPPAPR